MEINWAEVIIGVCSIVITGVIVPFVNAKWKIAKAEMSQETQETILYWTEVSVRWAKQWLQSETFITTITECTGISDGEYYLAWVGRSNNSHPKIRFLKVLEG